jgi:hypothetical protein
MTDMTTATMVNDVIEETSTDIQFSAREAPWMKLGKITDGVKNASEAAKLGGLDFKIALTEAYYAYDDGMKVAPKRKAVIREDTGEFFDLVSDTYQPLQYREAFDFMDAVDSLYVARRISSRRPAGVRGREGAVRADRSL